MVMMDIEAFTNKIQLLGFDICEPFETQHYNFHKDSATLPPIQTFSRPRTLSFLIGNTKSLWPTFKQHVQTLSTLSEHPLDDYISTTLPAVLASDFPQFVHKIQYTTSKGEDFIHFQLLAHLIGLVHFNRTLSLTVHPKYGPWIAYRAVFTFDLPFLSSLPFSPIPIDDPYPSCHENVLKYRNLFFESARDTCLECQQPSSPALESHKKECILVRMGTDELTGDEVRKWYAEKRDMRFIRTERNHQFLIMARDAATLPEVKDNRYSEEQMRYHYSKDKSCLVPLLKRNEN
ncbi:UNVERIFIED_CONTAM: hypothetical protein HDU68_008668 [Siphonaria sp. JEL0065]|nr:hypothetical protein HDU68_008668 [Siphonaria sp. JEL0065]